MEKNTGKVREFCHPGKVGTLMMHVMYLPPCEKTDACENITFLQLRLQAVTIGNVKERRISLW